MITVLTAERNNVKEELDKANELLKQREKEKEGLYTSKININQNVLRNYKIDESVTECSIVFFFVELLKQKLAESSDTMMHEIESERAHHQQVQISLYLQLNQ